jgi:hypothetical protein
MLSVYREDIKEVTRWHLKCPYCRTWLAFDEDLTLLDVARYAVFCDECNQEIKLMDRG